MATAIPQNRVPFTLEEIARATGGEVRVGRAREVAGITTDSRADVEGKLFVALSGEHFDGHAFAGDVGTRGARIVLLERDVEVPSELSVVRVPSTLAALGALALFHRKRWAGTLVAIAGSAGKTTTRSAVSALLAGILGEKVHFERGNLNNLIGVPMVLFGLGPEHDVAVVEVGTNQRGEVARLGAMVAPDVAVVTLIGIEHSEGLGDLDEIQAEEGDLYRALGRAGTAVGNADDARVMQELDRSLASEKLTYGSSPRAGYRLLARRSLPGFRSALSVARPTGEDLHFETGLHGVPGALALCAALAVAERVTGRALDANELDAGLELLGSGEPGRLTPIELLDGSVVLDDSYNANPPSMLASAETAKELARARGARLLFVVGEMRELGPLSEREHAAVGRALADMQPDALVAVGGDAAHLAAAAGPRARFARDAEAALSLVLEWVEPGDVVLVKASRGVRVERVVSGLVSAKGKAA